MHVTTECRYPLHPSDLLLDSVDTFDVSHLLKSPLKFEAPENATVGEHQGYGRREPKVRNKFQKSLCTPFIILTLRKRSYRRNVPL